MGSIKPALSPYIWGMSGRCGVGRFLMKSAVLCDQTARLSRLFDQLCPIHSAKFPLTFFQQLCPWGPLLHCHLMLSNQSHWTNPPHSHTAASDPAGNYRWQVMIFQCWKCEEKPRGGIPKRNSKGVQNTILVSNFQLWCVCNSHFKYFYLLSLDTFSSFLWDFRNSSKKHSCS